MLTIVVVSWLISFAVVVVLTIRAVGTKDGG